MKLLIMRHGEAGPHQRDTLRPLTDRGRRENKDVAQAVADEWQPGAIWCSPLVRARQTARIVADYASLEVIEQPFLKPEDPPEAVIDALQGYTDETPLLLVSHMPLVGALACLLVGDRTAHLSFGTSQILCLEMEIAAAGCAEFRQQYGPV